MPPDALGDNHVALQARIKREFEERYKTTLILLPLDEGFYHLAVEIDAEIVGNSDTKLTAPWGKGIREARLEFSCPQCSDAVR